MKPARYGCDNCGASYHMGKETVVRIYLRQPWFNYLETKCPRCKQVWFVCDLTDDTIYYLREYNHLDGDAIRFEAEDFATDEVWRQYCQYTGRPYPTPRQLSTRESRLIEREVAFFAYLLERGERWET